MEKFTSIQKHCFVSNIKASFCEKLRTNIEASPCKYRDKIQKVQVTKGSYGYLIFRLISRRVLSKCERRVQRRVMIINDAGKLRCVYKNSIYISY